MAIPKSIHKLNFKVTPDINDWTPSEQNFQFSLLDTSLEKEAWLRSKQLNDYYTQHFSQILDDKEVQAFIEVNKNINTKKTESNLKIWYKWGNSIGEKRNIEDIHLKN